MGLSLDQLDPPQADVAFVARSNNRVRVLAELTDAPRTRRELRDRTDVSQPTLGRILDAFEERGWVRPDGQAFALTPIGRCFAEAFDDLLSSVATLQRLQPLATRLPLGEMDFDLRRLADARITAPSSTDSSAHFRRERALLATRDRIRFLCTEAHPDTIETYRDWVAEGGSLDAVIAGDAIDAARADPEMGPLVADLLASDRVTISRYDGPVTVMLGRLDEKASIVPLDDSGVPCAFIESEEAAVVDWVTRTLDRHAAEATPIPESDST